MSLVGCTDRFLISYSKLYHAGESGHHLLSFTPIEEPKEVGWEVRFPLEAPSEVITQSSVQNLLPICHQNEEKRGFTLLSIVRKDKVPQKPESQKFSSSILLLEARKNDNESQKDFEDVKEDSTDSEVAQMDILDQISLDEKGEDSELRVFLSKPVFSPPVQVNYADDDGLSPECQRYLCRGIFFKLDDWVKVVNLEIFPLTEDPSKIKLISTERIINSFRWAQYLPELDILAYFTTSKGQAASYDDEVVSSSLKTDRPLLSVLQFHDKYPRETVLNLPLEPQDLTTPVSKAALTPNPYVLTDGSYNFRFLAHSSGSVYLLTLGASSDNTFSYKLSLLHYNKTLTMRIPFSFNGQEPLRIDAMICFGGQFVAVVAWPLFIHFLDTGLAHEPSHHLIFDYEALLPSPLVFRSILPNIYENSIKLSFEDLSIREIRLDSTTLFANDSVKKSPVNFRLATMHFLLFHLGDINAAKRMIYESGKITGNLHLTKIYQEFLIGTAFLQTRKQLTATLDSFLNLIPYCPFPGRDPSQRNVQITLLPSFVNTISSLLSPTQRILPHNETDTWTRLWESLKDSSLRFDHKSIADKLIVSLQCYKPEALSRASTPLTPSSPMVCHSFGDLAGLFGRRNQELQLPFAESSESCTANKQEYIFSINLRELSMHLLKEKKEWSSHGQSVAGKYVNALVEAARLLCHLVCISAHLPPTKPKDKGFKLIDTLDSPIKKRLFFLLEHYSLALGTLACPLPQGFTPFFVYLGYRVLSFEQFIWHVRSGIFDIQIDILKAILTDLRDDEEGNIAKKLHIISLLPKSRANRVLNHWSHPKSLSIRARQHASDLLCGIASTQSTRKNILIAQKRGDKGGGGGTRDRLTPINTFFQLLKAKANASEIDLGLLREATLLSLAEEKSDKVI